MQSGNSKFPEFGGGKWPEKEQCGGGAYRAEAFGPRKGEFSLVGLTGPMGHRCSTAVMPAVGGA
jgi:hypothetical protein